MGDYPSRVTLFDDGVYRWSYDMDMWHNRYLLRILMKVLGMICAVLFAFTLAAIGPSRTSPTTVGILLLVYAGVPALAALIYCLCALAMGGIYHLRFEMDDSAVALIQSAATKQRNNALAAIATIAGIAAGKPGEALRVGVTLRVANAAGTTALSAVRRVNAVPESDVIDLREWFGMNQIYVNAEDYPFVLEHIMARISQKARDRSRV